MFLINLTLNCLIFIVILNIGQWLSNRQRSNTHVGYSLMLPLALGTALTLVDSLRIGFLWQLVLFIIAVILIYWIFSV